MSEQAEALALYLVQAEGEQIVRDMAEHVGDQIFDILRRNGMAMSTAAGSAGVMILAAARVIGQAEDFLRRSLGGEADDLATAALAKLLLSEVPATVRAALNGDQEG